MRAPARPRPKDPHALHTLYSRHRLLTVLSSRHLRSDSGRYAANVGCIWAAWRLRGQASARCSGGIAGAGCRARVGACSGSRVALAAVARAREEPHAIEGGGRHGTTLSSRDQCMYLWIGIYDTDATYDTPLFNIQNNNKKVTKLTIPEQVGLG